MNSYFAGIQQSKETITRFSRVQFNIFKYKTKIAIICFCAGLLVIGLALLNTFKALAVILVFLACIIYANQDAGADYTANMVIDMFKSHYPKLKYVFTQSGYKINDNEKILKYKDVIKLVEDDEYLYIFQTEQYGIMIKASTVYGDEGLQGFKDFISKETKLRWTKQNRFLSMGSSRRKLSRNVNTSLREKGSNSIIEFFFGKQNK